MDKIEASNSYAALLWSTMGAALLTMIFYMLQVTKDGEFIPCPTCADIKEVFMSEKDKEEDPEPRARLMMSLKDCLESFLIGVGRVFPATIVLTLAWASGSIMTTVGCDRLFASWITGGISPESLPTLSFLISLFMALAVRSCTPCLCAIPSDYVLTLRFIDWNLMGNHGHSVPPRACSYV